MIGLFGGTFDPVHLGHLHAAQQARDRLGLRELRLVLSARPPHRKGSPKGPVASVHDRWQMLIRATRGRRGLRADDREVQRATRPSYTVDTLDDVRREYGAAEALVWCIGWDAFVELETWKDWTRLLTLAHLAVFRRPGPTVGLSSALQDLLAGQGSTRVADLARRPYGTVLILEAEMLDISATRIRRDLEHNRDVSRLLPPAVWSYIRQHQLYGG